MKVYLANKKFNENVYKILLSKLTYSCSYSYSYLNQTKHRFSSNGISFYYFPNNYLINYFSFNLTFP